MIPKLILTAVDFKLLWTMALGKVAHSFDKGVSLNMQWIRALAQVLVQAPSLKHSFKTVQWCSRGEDDGGRGIWSWSFCLPLTKNSKPFLVSCIEVICSRGIWLRCFCGWASTTKFMVWASQAVKSISKVLPS